MGLFHKKEEPVKIVLREKTRCARCGRIIRPNQEFEYIDRKVYCAGCGQAKRDWDLLELHALLDD